MVKVTALFCFVFFFCLQFSLGADRLKFCFIPPLQSEVDLCYAEHKDDEKQRLEWLHGELSKAYGFNKQFFVDVTLFILSLKSVDFLHQHIIAPLTGGDFFTTFSLLCAISAVGYFGFVKILQREAVQDDQIIAISCGLQNPVTLVLYQVIDRWYTGYVPRLLELIKQYHSGEVEAKVPRLLKSNFENLKILYEQEYQFESYRKELVTFSLELLQWIEKQIFVTE